MRSARSSTARWPSNSDGAWQRSRPPTRILLPANPLPRPQCPRPPPPPSPALERAERTRPCQAWPLERYSTVCSLARLTVEGEGCQRCHTRHGLQRVGSGAADETHDLQRPQHDVLKSRSPNHVVRANRKREQGSSGG